MWPPALFGHPAPLGGRALKCLALYPSYLCGCRALDCEPLARLLAFVFWLYWVTCGSQFPTQGSYPGIVPRPLAVKAWSPNHGTAREFLLAPCLVLCRPPAPWQGTALALCRLGHLKQMLESFEPKGKELTDRVRERKRGSRRPPSPL